jgi:hypothetical protein
LQRNEFNSKLKQDTIFGGISMIKVHNIHV